MEQTIIGVVWFGAVGGGAMGALAASQAVTGRPTIPLLRRIGWSVRELKLIGLIWAIYWFGMTIYILVSSLAIASNQHVDFLPMTIYPVILGGPAFQLLMERYHHRQWPFKGRVGNN